MAKDDRRAGIDPALFVRTLYIGLAKEVAESWTLLFFQQLVLRFWGGTCALWDVISKTYYLASVSLTQYESLSVPSFCATEQKSKMVDFCIDRVLSPVIWSNYLIILILYCLNSPSDPSFHSQVRSSWSGPHEP
jgi:hypothetical protein